MKDGKPSPNGWKNPRYFRSSVTHWAGRIRVEPRCVDLRPMTRKWASCSTKGFVVFNTQLLDESREFGKYVIVHELLHLQVPNHGRLFKSLLTAHMPDCKEREQLTRKLSAHPQDHAG